MLTMRWFLLLLALVVGTVQSLEAPKPIPPVSRKAEATNVSKNNPQNQQAISTDLPATDNVTVSGKLHVRADQEKGDRRESTNWAEWFIALFTLALVVVTGYLVRYTKKLWATTAKVATEARESSERQLRAYVSITASIARFADDGATLIFEVVGKNAGRTPAYKMTSWIATAFRDFPLQEPLNPLSKPDHRETLGPDCSSIAKKTNKREINTNEMAQLKGGTHALYVFGCFDYHDAFGVNRFTRFCLVYQGESVGGGLKRYKDGNDAS